MSVEEEWRPYRDGTYAVSSLGRVRRETTRTNAKAGAILSIRSMAKGGYLFANMSEHGKWVGGALHRIVAEVFHGPRPPGMQVDHIDGNKLNNRADNLEYVTRKVNMGRAAVLGLTCKGERHGNSKLKEADVLAIRAAHAAGGETQRAIAARFGVQQMTVSLIVRRVHWKHI